MMYFIIGCLLGLSVGFHIGMYGHILLNLAKELVRREPPSEGYVATPLPPDYADVTQLSGVVSPKSPEVLELEERRRLEELR